MADDRIQHDVSASLLDSHMTEPPETHAQNGHPQPAVTGSQAQQTIPHFSNHDGAPRINSGISTQASNPHFLRSQTLPPPGRPSAPQRDNSMTSLNVPKSPLANVSPTSTPAPSIRPQTSSSKPLTGGNNNDPVPPRQTGGRSHSKASRILKTWAAEIAAAVFAIGILVCEIVILAHYNRKFLFIFWPHSWQINAVIAFLTTFLEAAMSFYVAACIGQLRWYWFQKEERQLKWLDIMTNARQPSGALRLVFKKGSHKQIAVLGALIVILLLGVSTFSQNVITQVPHDFPWGNSTGWLPIQTNYSWYDTASSISIGDQQPVPQMVAAIQTGFYQFTYQPWIADSVIKGSLSAWAECEGDACDFGKYQSLAVCGQCEDMSSAVVNPCPKGNCGSNDYYSLSNGVDLSLIATNGIINMTSDTLYPVSTAISANAGPLIVRFHAMVAENSSLPGNGNGATALECAAWWCVKTYTGRMANGTVEEFITSTWTNKSTDAKTTYLQDENIYLHPPDCWVNNSVPTNQSYCTYMAGATTEAALQNFLTGGNITSQGGDQAAKAFLTGSITYTNYPNSSTTFNYTTPLAGALDSISSANGDITASIRQGFTTMTNFMSVTVREAFVDENSYEEYTYGNATTSEQQFHVRWGWLSFPISLLVVSIIFLITTIILSRNDHAWKSSTLAFIFHGFGDADRQLFSTEYGDMNAEELMKTVRQEQHVTLHREDNGLLVFKSGTRVPRKGSTYSLANKAGQGTEIGVSATVAGMAGTFAALSDSNINF